MATQKQAKWEGKATANLNGVRAEQVWALLEDFCSIHKYLPTIDTCHQVEGIEGQPGLVRYCASNPSSSSTSSILDTNDEEIENLGKIKWCHEKLITIDPKLRSLSYEVLDNNFGIKSYVASVELLPTNTTSDDGRDTFGCQIEWSFLADPVDGLTCQDFSSYLNLALQGMAEKMERVLQSK